MLTKTYVAAVGKPVLVDIPRCRAMAWYARKMKDMVSIRKMHPVLLETIFSLCAEGEVSGAAVFAASGTERGEDFFLGDNRLSLAAGAQSGSHHPIGR